MEISSTFALHLEAHHYPKTALVLCDCQIWLTYLYSNAMETSFPLTLTTKDFSLVSWFNSFDTYVYTFFPFSRVADSGILLKSLYSSLCYPLHCIFMVRLLQSGWVVKHNCCYGNQFSPTHRSFTSITNSTPITLKSDQITPHRVYQTIWTILLLHASSIISVCLSCIQSLTVVFFLSNPGNESKRLISSLLTDISWLTGKWWFRKVPMFRDTANIH